MMEESPAIDWSEIDRLRGVKWVAAVLRERRLLTTQLNAAERKLAAAKLVAGKKRAALSEFDEMLRPRMRRRRRLLMRRFGGHARTEDGEISIRTANKVLDVDPSRMRELVAELLRRRGGRKVLRIKYELDKEALKQMSPDFLRSLVPFGVRVGQMSYVSIKSIGDKGATNLVRRRRNEGSEE